MALSRHSAFCTIALVAASLCGASPLSAQRWIPPEEPCDVPGNHYLFRSASLYLKQAAETSHPAERDRFLTDADRVLVEALGTEDLSQSPTPWYYLGRLYTLRNDPSGADSAFATAEKLQPACHDDIARWRKELAPHALRAAALGWQAKQADSAIRMLKMVERLDPENPQGKIELMRLYVELEMLDSADWARRGAEAVATADSSMDRRRRTAHYAIVRAYRQRVLAHPASSRLSPTRSQLETVGQRIAGDSTVLAEMNAEVGRIRASGARLNEASLRAFQAESTTRSNRIAEAAVRRDSLVELASADSAALEAVLEPAIAAYEEFLDAGMHVEAGAELAGLYAYRGDAAAVDRVTERIVAEAGDVRENLFFLAGNSLLGAGQPAAAARLLSTGLAKNPYHRNGLYLLARAQIGRARPDSGLAVARELRAVDPLNDQPLRLLALAFDRLGEADSARYYQSQADSGLVTLVTVTQFTSTDSAATFGATVRNRSQAAIGAMAVGVDFLAADGAVVHTEQVDVPPLEGAEFHSFTARAEGVGIVAWRYRRL